MSKFHSLVLLFLFYSLLRMAEITCDTGLRTRWLITYLLLSYLAIYRHWRGRVWHWFTSSNERHYPGNFSFVHTLCGPSDVLLFSRPSRRQSPKPPRTALSIGSTYQRFDFYWQEKGSARSQNIPTGLHVHNRQQSIERKNNKDFCHQSRSPALILDVAKSSAVNKLSTTLVAIAMTCINPKPNYSVWSPQTMDHQDRLPRIFIP
jgi:hypothetical protein